MEKRKNGHPQLTCNNNYAKVIEKIMPNNKPLSNKQAPLKEWLPLAVDESNWMQCIDDYFNSCRNIINLDELDPKNMNEAEPHARALRGRLLLPTTTGGCSHDQLIQTVAKRWFLTVGPACIAAGMLERSSTYVALLVAVCT